MNERATAKPLLVLILAIGALAVAAGLAWRWATSSHRTSLSDLGPDDRQRLIEEALTESPAVFQPAWFEPRVGYTLRPGGRIRAWGDSFLANALGYRAPPPVKPAGVFRVVFLGDSWTYGMGVKGRESFPVQFEKIANGRRPPGAAGAPRVQAWPLALPGYNTLNELAALELLFDRLRPDAVVLCPTPNDIDSSNAVTPAGMLARSREPADDFGDPHSYRFLLPIVDAPSFHRRWRQAFARAAETERLLGERGIPFFVYFAATWEDSLAHSLMEEGGLNAPYAITPAELTVGAWRNPPPFRHGTPQANRRYARFVYRLVADSLGWPDLSEGGRPSPESERVFRSPPTPSARPARDRAARKAVDELPTSFEPGPTAAPQCLAAMDCETGIAPKASTFLLRRRAGSSRIALALGRLPAPTWLYPLTVEVRVADDREVVRSTLLIPAEGPPEAEFLVPSPRGASAAIEVTLLAERASASSTVLAGHSFFVRRIEQR